MGDNPEPINGQNKTMFPSYHLKEFPGKKIQRKKRSFIQYVDCAGHPETQPPSTNEVDPTCDLSPAAVNEHDPDDKMKNEDGPVDRISPAPENRDKLNAAVANGDNPVAKIPPAPENRVDPDGEIEAAVDEMPTEMREYITERMGGYGLQMIIEKALTATDMRKDQGRLSLPAKQLRAEFLTAEEVTYFEDRSEVNNGLNYIDTIVVGSDLRENPMQFKKWLLGARFVDFLLKNWNFFSKTYGLKVGNRVRIWSFRVDQRNDENDIVKSELCFALIKL